STGPASAGTVQVPPWHVCPNPAAAVGPVAITLLRVLITSVNQVDLRSIPGAADPTARDSQSSPGHAGPRASRDTRGTPARARFTVPDGGCGFALGGDLR